MNFFIWNDRDWHLLNAGKKIPENYVVVRKLFVQWAKLSDTKDMKNLIHQEFAKYGELRKIDMLNEQVDHQDEVAVEMCEAYVTFNHCNNAYKAFMAHRKQNGAFPIEVETVLPADSWRQPLNKKEEKSVNEAHKVWIKDENGSVKQNENFLFPQLLMNDQPPLQLENKFLIDMDADIPLKTWLIIARAIRDHIEYIFLKISSESTEANQNSLTIEEYEKRFVQVIANNCAGELFKAMTIVSKRPISWEILCSMAPLLNPLVSLIVKNSSSGCLLYRLPILCPNLRMLRVSGDWYGDCLDDPVKNWPSLKVLALTYQRLDVRSCSEDGEKFREFIQQNQQLEKLMLDTTIDIELLRGIVGNLLNINQLSFRRPSYYRANLLLDCLTQATSLESITITFDEAETEDLEKIVVVATRLGQMPNIQLVTLIQNYMPNTEYKEDFTKLSKFPVTEHRNCECHYNRRILNFDDEIRDVRVPKDLPILVIVINTNHPDKSMDKSLQRDILNMLEETTPSFPDFITLEVMKREDHYVYVHIGSAESAETREEKAQQTVVRTTNHSDMDDSDEY